jgi:hypothetical protein
VSIASLTSVIIYPLTDYPQLMIDDRVQWHRSWAEMTRWLEEFELKHVELMRCAKSFESMRSAWSTLAAKESRSGYSAFARQQAHIYAQLYEDAAGMYARKAEPHFQVSDHEIPKAMLAFREKELDWLLKMAGVAQAAKQAADLIEETPTRTAHK